jgi:hypothetical protein
MSQEEKPIDVTEPLLELLGGIDFAFKSGELITPQAMQERYASALAAMGRFLSKIDPAHADRFFDLSDAFADLSTGSPPHFQTTMASFRTKSDTN